MSRSLVLLCVLLVGSAGVSGCFGDDTLTGASSAPAWSPGHTWSWETTSTEKATFGDEEYEESETGVLTHTVLAKAPMLDGPPVYWVKSSTQGDPDPAFPGLNLLDGGDVVFVDPTGLTVTNSGHGDMDHPCGGGTLSLRYDGDDEDDDPGSRTLDLVRFPLEPGNTWEGQANDVTYRAEVAASEKKQTPAGTFRALRIDFSFDVQAEEDETVIIDEQSTSVWYAPEAEHIVASTLSLKARIQDDGEEGTFMITHDIALASHGLAKEKAGILPEILDSGRVESVSDDDGAAPGYRIVRVGGEEPNIAEGPYTATFGVAEGAGPPQVDGEEEALAAEEIDALGEGQTLRWRIARASTGTGMIAEGTGDTFEHTFDEGGRYDIFVDAIDPKNGDVRCADDTAAALVLSSRLDIYHREIHVVNVTAGPAAAVDVTSLEVDGDVVLYVRHDVTQPTDDDEVPDEVRDLEDHGLLVLQGAGMDERSDGYFVDLIREAGSIEISWEPIGKTPPAGDAIPVVSGHEVTIDIRVQWF